MKVAHLQKLVNRNGKQFFQKKKKKLWSFDKSRNVLTKKKKKKTEILAVLIMSQKRSIGTHFS